MIDPMAEDKISLEWGQTPFDDLSREDLLLEVKRMYAALVSTTSALSLVAGNSPSSLFWERHGTGYDALRKSRQILGDIYEGFDKESIYRSYFRYADDVLFEDAGSGWVICTKCGVMIAGSREKAPPVGSGHNDKLPMDAPCDGIFRLISEADLLPQRPEVPAP